MWSCLRKKKREFSHEYSFPTTWQTRGLTSFSTSTDWIFFLFVFNRDCRRRRAMRFYVIFLLLTLYVDYAIKASAQYYDDSDYEEEDDDDYEEDIDRDGKMDSTVCACVFWQFPDYEESWLDVLVTFRHSSLLPFPASASPSTSTYSSSVVPSSEKYRWVDSLPFSVTAYRRSFTRKVKSVWIILHTPPPPPPPFYTFTWGKCTLSPNRTILNLKWDLGSGNSHRIF